MVTSNWADDRLSREMSQLRSMGESQELEYMAKFPENTHELAKEIAAFATSNQGTILIGVSDAGELLGLSDAETPEGRDAFLRRLHGICSGTVKPSITPVAKFAMENERVVLVIAVPKGSQPLYYCNDKPYLRNITEARPAQPQEVIDLVTAWLSTTHRQSEQTQSAKSAFLSRLASILIEVLILSDEALERQTNPWFDAWRGQFESSGSELAQLAADDEAQSPDLQAALSALRDALDEAATFEPLMGSNEEMGRLIERVKTAGLNLKDKFIDRVGLDTASRELALGTVTKIGRQLTDLAARAQSLEQQGRVADVQSEASRLGHSLLSVIGYAGVMEEPNRSALKEVGRELHLCETIPLWMDGGKSTSLVVQTVQECHDKFTEALGSSTPE